MVWDNVVVDIPVVFSDYYRGDFAPADFTAARVYDLWKGGAPMGEFRHNLTAKAVAPHSCRAVRVDVLAGADPRPLKTEDDPFAFREEDMSPPSRDARAGARGQRGWH